MPKKVASKYPTHVSVPVRDLPMGLFHNMFLLKDPHMRVDYLQHIHNGEQIEHMSVDQFFQKFSSIDLMAAHLGFGATSAKKLQRALARFGYKWN